MKLIAQVAAGVTLALLVLWLQVGLAVDSANSARSAAPSCNGSAVMTAASTQLADWLNQKVGKDNVYHVHGTFAVEISTSVTVGNLQSTQHCMAIASVGISQAGGTPLVAQQPFNLHFFLATDQDGLSQITLDEGNLLSNGGAFDTAGSLLMEKAQGEQSTAQQQATSPPQWQWRSALPAGTSGYVMFTCIPSEGPCFDMPKRQGGDEKVFTSLQGCISSMTVIPGKLVNGRLYTTLGGEATGVYFECVKPPL